VRGFESGDALARRKQVGASGDERYAAVAELEQVLGRPAHPVAVIDHDRVRPRGVLAIDEHDGISADFSMECSCSSCSEWCAMISASPSCWTGGRRAPSPGAAALPNS
jgi:hypothetical protein